MESEPSITQTTIIFQDIMNSLAHQTRWSTISKVLVQSRKAHCRTRIKPPQFRVDLLEAVFGTEFDNYRDSFPSHDLYHSCGLMLLPLLRLAVCRLPTWSEEHCSSDILGRVVDLIIAIARYIKNRDDWLQLHIQEPSGSSSENGPGPLPRHEIYRVSQYRRTPDSGVPRLVLYHLVCEYAFKPVQ